MRNFTLKLAKSGGEGNLIFYIILLLLIEVYNDKSILYAYRYLLYGPPGTGKSSLIAAMANQLKYSVYDLELTSVKNNTMLRSLLLMTKKKSIIVIEDVDCSLDLAGKRKTKKKKKDEEIDELLEKYLEEKESTVTLSGLLNFIDGLWSACCGERLIVFTTNHLNKIDPALIRPGRMDMHIELSYCSFEAFKVCSKPYIMPTLSYHLNILLCFHKFFMNFYMYIMSDFCQQLSSHQSAQIVFRD